VVEMNNEETTEDESRLEWCMLKLGMKNKDQVVIFLLEISIPLDTSQFGGNEKLFK